MHFKHKVSFWITFTACFVFAVVTGRDLEPDAEAILQQKAEAMEAMVAKYSVDLPSPRVPAGGPLPKKKTVLVTGTTGRLGCHLLAQLIHDPKICHIYALNRASAGAASPEALLKRMRSAFESWELDPALLESGKVTLLASNYAAERLGSDASTYAEIESQLTTIIHTAWRVDFNVALSGFEPLIAGVRRLVDLASASSVSGGARVLLVSSVSVFLVRLPTGQLLRSLSRMHIYRLASAMAKASELPRRYSSGLAMRSAFVLGQCVSTRSRAIPALAAGTSRNGLVSLHASVRLCRRYPSARSRSPGFPPTLWLRRSSTWRARRSPSLTSSRPSRPTGRPYSVPSLSASACRSSSTTSGPLV
ncbi:hypothetical protein PENSPDRAFT_157560 [Peniophora sp. CONT]|nr:hypothetical protein PENSPDRAFT_157560 [Peniophora sp. CONT]